jgi:hypothetical protein
VSKKRVVKDFDKLPKDIQAAVRAEFPNGFTHKLIQYGGPKGEKIQALPFETDDTIYLVRMNIMEARAIQRDDDDSDEVGAVRDDLNLDELDLETAEAESGSSDDDDDDYDNYNSRRGRRNRDDEDDGDEDY